MYAEWGDLDPAATIARLALARADCADADQAVLDRAGDPPDDWKARLDDLAANPSDERWQELTLFVRVEQSDQQHRNYVRYLR